MNIRIALGILAASVSALAASAKENTNAVPYKEAVEVFVAGKDNVYASIRIPCIVNAGGLLVAVAEGRYQNHDQGENDLIVSVSRNGGKTWSKPEIAAKSDKGSTFNNPCLIYDAEAKQIMLFFQRYPKGVSEQGSVQPSLGWDEKDTTLRNFVCFSKNGKRWSKPVEVTTSTRHEDCSTLCSGPNPGVQITRGEHKGRLVVVFNEAPRFGNWHITSAYSDDHGKTWKMGEKSTSGMGVNEVSSVETDDGGVFVVSRAYGGPGGSTRRVAYSEDAGETWGETTYHEELPSHNCQNGLTRYSFEDDKALGGKSRILFSACSPGRVDGFIKMSYDGGKTWPVEKSVGSGPFAYSAMCPLKPGSVALLFESQAPAKISFVPISIKWLTNGEDTGVGAAKK